MFNKYVGYTDIMYKRHYKRERRNISPQEILEWVADNEPQGVSVNQMARKFGLHRETIGLYSEKLKKQGLITRKTKVDKYHITDKARGHPALIPFSLGTAACRDLLNWRHTFFDNKYCNNQMCSQKITQGMDRNCGGINLKYLFGNDEVDELALFEFSNRIGAFVTYNLLQAIKPERETNTTLTSKVTKSNEGTDDMAFQWMENVIKPGIILHEFCNMAIIERGISFEGESYIINKKTWEKLVNSFKKIYPYVYSDLETLKRESLKGIETKARWGNLTFNK